MTAIEREFNPPENDADRRQKRRELAQTLAKGGMTDVHVLSHESAEAVLTPKRTELLRALRHEDVTSVRDLADLVDRDHGQVSRDLKTLAEHGIVGFDTDGRAKRPYLQHKHIVVEPVL